MKMKNACLISSQNFKDILKKLIYSVCIHEYVSAAIIESLKETIFYQMTKASFESLRSFFDMIFISL